MCRLLENLITTYKLLDSHYGVIRLLKEVSDPDLNTIPAIVCRARALARKKYHKESLAEYERACAIDNNNAWVIASRSESKKQMGRYEEALADLRQAIAPDKDPNRTLNNLLGLTLSYLERYTEAIEVYERELADDPQDYSVLYNMAVAITRFKGLSEGQYWIDLARNALLSKVETSERSHALYGLAGLEALTGNTDLSLMHLQQSIELGSDGGDWAQHDMAWLDLRTDPRFQSLIAIN